MKNNLNWGRVQFLPKNLKVLSPHPDAPTTQIAPRLLLPILTSKQQSGSPPTPPRRELPPYRPSNPSPKLRVNGNLEPISSRIMSLTSSMSMSTRTSLQRERSINCGIQSRGRNIMLVNKLLLLVETNALFGGKMTIRDIPALIDRAQVLRC
jgi:hypothetical protein